MAKKDSGKPARQRLDVAVVERGLAETRARAQAIIMGGGVTVEGRIETKPGSWILPENRIQLLVQPLPYVSRGGLKLQHALERFSLGVDGRIAVDVGSSTGGFTDVLLKAGALRVYAIDVGYGQLAWELRNDPRVVVMERTNIRDVTELPELAQIAVVDVSFISLKHVLAPVHSLLAPDGEAVVLIKPQFEAGRDRVGRKGVVRDPDVWRDVLHRVIGFAQQSEWGILGLERSPITGPAGNVEFLAHLVKGDGTAFPDIQQHVEAVMRLSSGESPLTVHGRIEAADRNV